MQSPESTLPQGLSGIGEAGAEVGQLGYLGLDTREETGGVTSPPYFSCHNFLYTNSYTVQCSFWNRNTSLMTDSTEAVAKTNCQGESPMEIASRKALMAAIGSQRAPGGRPLITWLIAAISHRPLKTADLARLSINARTALSGWVNFLSLSAISALSSSEITFRLEAAVSASFPPISFRAAAREALPSSRDVTIASSSALKSMVGFFRASSIIPKTDAVTFFTSAVLADATRASSGVLGEEVGSFISRGES
mmetsp:Transcript_8422/g.16364  ORF Transcript_8422/g.16364 Transcript_8422/m.16364 type:complete len:251 (+) Transcript_8422:448-1200(+)